MSHKTYGMIGMLTPFIFLITYILMDLSRPGYSLFTKAVSELSSVDAPNKWIWNIFGYIVPGILISIYAIGLFKSVTGKKANKPPLYGILLSGSFMALSGVFPGDFDDRASPTMLVHTIGSFGSYVFFLIGAFTYPKQMKKTKYWKSAIKPTLIFTYLTIIFGAWVFLFPNMPALGQRIVFFFYFLWIFYTAIKLYNQPIHRNRALT